MNLPNKLTVVRLLLIPVFVVLFYWDFPLHYLFAAIVFTIATCTDFLDGYLARKYNLVTNLGKFLDPIADKVLVSTAIILLLTVPEFYSFYVPGEIVMPCLGVCASLILARELIVSGFRMVAASAGLVLAADKLGKWKTFFQDVAIIVILVSGACSGSLGNVLMWIGLVALAVATVLTVVSGCHYIIRNKEVLKS